MILVKDVTVNIMAGATDSIVKIKSISKRTDIFWGSDLPAANLRVKVGISAPLRRCGSRINVRGKSLIKTFISLKV